jgi:periplasmic divalent cation tolerance protein
MTEHALVLITCGNVEEARSIARSLVENRLAAGAQLLPIESYYRWQGEIVEDTEMLVLAKTRVDRFDSLRAMVEEAHSYQVPPVVMLDMSAANRPYLEWIDDNVL